jgi:hypothetical protein
VRRQIIADCETTSLAADYASGRGVIWELALIERDTGREHLWRMKPDLAKADPGALTVGRYYERTAGMCKICGSPDRAHDLAQVPPLRHDSPEWSSPSAVAAEVAPLLHDVTLIAANPAFDAGFLAAFLNHYGQAATWNYRLRDIGSMAWAWLQGGHLPHHLATPAMDAGSDDFAAALGVDPAGFERHSALGDCRLVAAMLAVIEDGAP